MATPRVVVTQRFFDDETTHYLQANGCEVNIAEASKVKGDGNLSHDQLVSILSGADAWIVGHARVTRELLEALPELKIVARRGVGYERVDVEAARALGRVVTIAAGGNDASVADHALGLMLAVGRRLRETQMNMVAGNWTILISSDLYRKTVGLIGLGRIGRNVVQRLKGFEARILVSARTVDEAYAEANGITYVDVDTLLRESDYVSLHAPLSPTTRNLINKDTLALMKPTAVLINTARGGLVEDRDLLEALKGGTIAGAGLDVFLSETDAAYRSVSDELIALPNVVASPHSAASSVEGLARTNMVAAQCVIAVLNGKDPPSGCVVADGRGRASR
ncbi:hydroxyacid dehydrogenase [Mesorhizobium waimense]|uniref:Hydroxyacid dehydrogenase n=1 Tax=Mesorhizobium waimense TaxID=1300307 RepID=A0A3A5KWZ4_9HYPH|nr:phosphoglycerate dehydrogenase [Mesorhizobium waimense]RJT41282.1 hydroxyacid dehydrogenase [Mesorhizobium waimense]